MASSGRSSQDVLIIDNRRNLVNIADDSSIHIDTVAAVRDPAPKANFDNKRHGGRRLDAGELAVRRGKR